MFYPYLYLGLMTTSLSELKKTKFVFMRHQQFVVIAVSGVKISLLLPVYHVIQISILFLPCSKVVEPASGQDRERARFGEYCALIGYPRGQNVISLDSCLDHAEKKKVISCSLFNTACNVVTRQCFCNMNKRFFWQL